MVQFVITPNITLLREKKLQYLDLLTYFAIRKHLNTKSKIAYPSLDTIATLSGLSRKFIIASIKRLEKANLVTVYRAIKKANQYSFPEVTSFQMIPEALLQDTNLTTQEKAILICLRQFFYSDSLMSTYNLQDIAKSLDLSYDLIQRQTASLKRKGYITSQLRYFPTDVDGQTLMIEKQTLMLNQQRINWALKEEVIKLHQTDLDIIALIEQMELSPELRQQLQILKKTAEIKKSYAENTFGELIVE